VPQSTAAPAPIRRRGLSRGHRSALQGSVLLSVILVAVGLLVVYFGQRYQIRLVYAAYVNLLVVLGLQVFMGNANITNLSHSAFMGIGAYAAAICVTPVKIKAMSLPEAPWGLNNFALDPVTSAIIAIIITALIALLIGMIISRLSGIGATIVTLAVLVIVHSIFLHRTDIFKGKQAFFGIPRVFDIESILIITVIAIFVARFFRESRWGLQLRASSDDEVGARAMGVNVFRVRLIAWVYDQRTPFLLYPCVSHRRHADSWRHAHGNRRSTWHSPDFFRPGGRTLS